MALPRHPRHPHSMRSPSSPRPDRSSPAPLKAEHYRLLVESVVDYAIFLLDPAGNIVSWNPGAVRIKGYSAEEIIGRHFSVFYPAEDVASGIPDTELRDAAQKGRIELEGWRIRKDGTRFWANVVISALRDERGGLVGFGKVTRDLTERKRAEDKIRSLNDELASHAAALSDVNAELEAFSFSIAHDLRAPLRRMTSYLRLLGENCGRTLDAEGRQYLEKINAGALYMGRLIDGILELARVGKQEPVIEEISLDEVLQSALAEASADCGGRSIDWRLGGLFRMRGSFILMKQVFVNLLCNCLKYTRKTEHPVIEVGFKTENGERVVFVRDNGVGFDMSHAGKLFGVFQRLHDAQEFEGIGIGLAIVARIVRRHGGRIWAESEPGKGATFSFTIGKDWSKPA